MDAGRGVSAPRQAPLAGIGWMVLTGLLFVGVTAIVKHVGDDLPAAQAAFLRFAFGLVIMLPLAGQLARLRLTRDGLALFALRGAVHTAAVILWFFAMARLPMAEVTAMNHMAPIYVTLGAALFLGEPLALRRMAAIGVAFLGMLVILRPGFRVIEPGHLAMLGTGFFMGASYLIAKRASGQYDAGVVVWMLSIAVTIGLAPFAAAKWVPPTAAQMGWLFLVALLATAAHYAMTLAFRAAPVGVTQPVVFLQLVWSVLLGWALFGEPADVWVVAGGAMIVAAISYIAWREARLKRRQKPDPRA